jgi:hypothetical protein
MIAGGVAAVLGIGRQQAEAMLRKAGLRVPASHLQPGTTSWVDQAERFEAHLATIVPKLGINVPARLSATPVPTAYRMTSPSELAYANWTGQWLALVGLPDGTYSTLAAKKKGDSVEVAGDPLTQDCQFVHGNQITRGDWESLLVKTSFVVGSITKPELEFGGQHGR